MSCHLLERRDAAGSPGRRPGLMGVMSRDQPGFGASVEVFEIGRSTMSSSTGAAAHRGRRSSSSLVLAGLVDRFTQAHATPRDVLGVPPLILPDLAGFELLLGGSWIGKLDRLDGGWIDLVAMFLEGFLRWRDQGFRTVSCLEPVRGAACRRRRCSSAPSPCARYPGRRDRPEAWIVIFCSSCRCLLCPWRRPSTNAVCVVSKVTSICGNAAGGGRDVFRGLNWRAILLSAAISRSPWKTRMLTASGLFLGGPEQDLRAFSSGSSCCSRSGRGEGHRPESRCPATGGVTSSRTKVPLTSPLEGTPALESRLQRADDLVRGSRPLSAPLPEEVWSLPPTTLGMRVHAADEDNLVDVRPWTGPQSLRRRRQGFIDAVIRSR